MSEHAHTEVKDKRQVVLLAVLAAVALLTLYLAFGRGGGTSQDQNISAAAPTSRSVAPAEPVGTAGDAGRRAPVETYQVFASRDPFDPVVENGSKGKGVDADAVMGEDPLTEPSPQGQQANSGAIEGQAVTLVDVFRAEGKDRAQVEIDAGGYDVEVGQIFAENFQLVSTSGDCATLLYGDDQFTLCEGEEILK